MARGDSGGTSARWPVHSAYFWCRLLAGVGVGLLLGAALVELEVLTSRRKAWASLLGACWWALAAWSAGVVNRATQAGPNQALHLTGAAGRLVEIRRSPSGPGR